MEWKFIQNLGTIYTTHKQSMAHDSIANLSLIINNSYEAFESVTSCGGYVWNEEVYTQSGDYTYTSNTDDGCDSIITLR